MKLLLDENLPKKLKLDFPLQDIFTVREMSWQGIKNGELLKMLIKENFDVLLTFDKNLQYQQNFEKYTIAVFVLNASINTYDILTKLSPKINATLETGDIKPGPTIFTEK
jgi:rRNA maturation protein Rpf1